MALYPKAVKRLIPHNEAQDPHILPRVAILHVDAGGATGADLARYFTSGSGGIESHFTIDYDGTVTQFRDTYWQADANMQANNFAISIETQGKADGSWTDAQLASIKALLLWLNTTHKIPLVKCPTWFGYGVGYHILFMQEWAGGPRSCPGPKRIRQFYDVLVPWMAGAKSPASAIPSIPKPAPPKGVAPKALTVDGDRGPATYRMLQAYLNYAMGAGLKIDGDPGPATWRAVEKWVGDSINGSLSPAGVKALQRKVGATPDGSWGPATTRALQLWLNNHRTLLRY